MRVAGRLAALSLVALCAGRAWADAIVRTQAMRASTIAEVFVEPDRLAVELEIGLVDLDAFRNLLPDDIYERLEHPPAPHAARVRPPMFDRRTARPGWQGGQRPASSGSRVGEPSLAAHAAPDVIHEDLVEGVLAHSLTLRASVVEVDPDR